MFRELDQRHGGQLTVTLEWDPDTGRLRVRCEDHRVPGNGCMFPVEPADARHAFLHPRAACPADCDPAGLSGPSRAAQAAGRRNAVVGRAAETLVALLDREATTSGRGG